MATALDFDTESLKLQFGRSLSATEVELYIDFLKLIDKLQFGRNLSVAEGSSAHMPFGSWSQLQSGRGGEPRKGTRTGRKTPAQTSFNVAAAVSRGKCPEAAGHLPGLSGFNVAAAVQPRKASPSIAAASESLVLQCGRGCSAAESTLMSAGVSAGPRGGKLSDSTVRHNLVTHLIEPLKSQFPTPPDELGFEEGRLHSFRHYFTSESFRNGAEDYDLLAWLGHRDSKMVAHYRHLRPDDSKRRMQQIKFFDLPDQGKADLK